VAVVAIGILAVRQADRFLARRRPSVLFEVDEAVEFVASAVPDWVSAELSYEDVEALLGWHLIRLHEQRGAGRAPVLVDEAVVDDLLRRAEADGRAVTRAQVRAVLDAELAYLSAVGALDEET
jgi:hypothetical protein